MKKTICEMRHALLMFCHTHATLKEFYVLMRDNWKRSPASRATYVVSLDRALERNHQSESA